MKHIRLLASTTFTMALGIASPAFAADCACDQAVHQGPRIIWSLDADGISLHKLDVDNKCDKVTGRLPYNPRYGAAEKNWRCVAETEDKKLWFVRADGISDWMCHLYCLDTDSIKHSDELQPLMVAQIRDLSIQVDERRQYLGLTAGPDSNLYLTVYKNVLGDNDHVNGLWRVGINDKKFEFVGQFKNFKPGQPFSTDSDFTPQNAFFGGIAYESFSKRFYGYGFNSQGKPRLYWMPADFVKTNVNAVLPADFWQSNGTEGLYGITFDNYGFPFPRVHRGEAYVSRMNDGVFKFRNANGIISAPVYKVGDIYMGYGLAIEPYSSTKISAPKEPAIQKAAARTTSTKLD